MPDTFRVLAESDWYAEVGTLTVPGPTGALVRVGDVLAAILRVEVDLLVRAPAVNGAHRRLGQVRALSAETAGDRDVPPKLLQFDSLLTATESVHALVAELVADGQEFTVQTNEAADHEQDARAARASAYLYSRAAAARIGELLDAAPASTPSVHFPQPGITLGGAALGKLAATLSGLVPDNADDEQGNPAAQPVDDPATLLPAAVDLLVSRDVRDTGGGFGGYPAQARPRPGGRLGHQPRHRRQLVAGVRGQLHDRARPDADRRSCAPPCAPAACPSPTRPSWTWSMG